MNQDLGFTQLQSPTPSCQGLNIDIYKLIDKHGLGVWCPSMSAAPPPPLFLFFLQSTGKINYGTESQDSGHSGNNPI